MLSGRILQKARPLRSGWMAKGPLPLCCSQSPLRWRVRQKRPVESDVFRYPWGGGPVGRLESPRLYPRDGRERERGESEWRALWKPELRAAGTLRTETPGACRRLGRTQDAAWASQGKVFPVHIGVAGNLRVCGIPQTSPGFSGNPQLPCLCMRGKGIPLCCASCPRSEHTHPA